MHVFVNWCRDQGRLVMATLPNSFAKIDITYYRIGNLGRTCFALTGISSLSTFKIVADVNMVHISNNHSEKKI